MAHSPQARQMDLERYWDPAQPLPPPFPFSVSYISAYPDPNNTRTFCATPTRTALRRLGHKCGQDQVHRQREERRIKERSGAESSSFSVQRIIEFSGGREGDCPFVEVPNVHRRVEENRKPRDPSAVALVLAGRLISHIMERARTRTE